ncbi:MAG TPA: tail fiber protein [Bacteroidales bacterium]|nr:tail fiber protein [Bacteroidales bacterium]
MAKIRRKITPKRGEELPSKKGLSLPGGIKKIIPVFRPVKPIPEVPPIDPQPVAEETGETTSPENATNSTATNASNTGGSTGNTDPGTAGITSSISTDMEQMIGEIRMFAGNFAPKGWALCNGQLLNITTETQALYSLIGTVYGGDGRANFALPDLRGRVPVHAGQGTGLSNYTLGASGGQEAISLTPQNMPAHNHGILCSDNAASETNPAGKMMAKGSQVFADPGYQQARMHNEMVEITGGSQPHENLQPYLAINFIIALDGVYPARQ